MPQKFGRKWLTIFVFMVVFVVAASFASTTPAQAMWCGRLSSYTTWYYSNVEHYWKPILYVWKGVGKANPKYVSVWYNSESVPNADYGIQTSSPQVDDRNGWVGYFIAKRWYSLHWQWDDDWRWEVRGCVP